MPENPEQKNSTQQPSFLAANIIKLIVFLIVSVGIVAGNFFLENYLWVLVGNCLLHRLLKRRICDDPQELLQSLIHSNDHNEIGQQQPQYMQSF